MLGRALVGMPCGLGLGCRSCSASAVAVLVFWTCVAGAVVEVSEVPWFGGVDGLVTACAVDLAAGDGGFELGSEALMVWAVAALECGAAGLVCGPPAGVASAGGVGSEGGAALSGSP